MTIFGFGINGYKNFCEETQYFGPFSKINIFIGKNNAGKSNILLFIQNHFSNSVKLACKYGGQITLSAEEIPQVNTKNKYTFALPVENSESSINEIVANYKLPNMSYQKDVVSFFTRILKSNTFLNNSGLSWFRFETVIQNNINELNLSHDFIKEIVNEQIAQSGEWGRIFQFVTHQSGGGFEQHWIPDTLMSYIKRFYPQEKISSEIFLIPAIRRVEKSEDDNRDWDYSGKGLIERLAILQNPTFTQLNNKENFEKINSFLRDVIGNTTARISIPHDRETILVEINGKTLPLSSLGTGIHEVIILAATATTFEDKVICIEEPELHLHPYLQGKLIEYLEKKTTNQYFISTHSAIFINTPRASIFHITLENEYAVVKSAISFDEKFEICKDLGYHASDLLQANCVIWVEGPSDRIYLNYWIRNKTDELLEGIHYSIMFYGGKLLSHLTTSEEQIEKFISLKKLNRNVSIIMDSDKKHARDRIRETVARISSEFINGNGIAWVTNGKEIENYIVPETLIKGIQQIDPIAKEIKNLDKYCNALCYLTEDNKEKLITDKVKLANEITNFEPDYSVLDLNKKVDSIIEFIRQSNK
jgi:predicted ATP-dependent endonuclease of OLD family